MTDRKIPRWTGAYVLAWGIFFVLVGIWILLAFSLMVLGDIREAVQ